MTYRTTFGEKLGEGKTKIVYAHPTRRDLVYLVHKDRITAGDGARASELPGKGELACRTTSSRRVLTRTISAWWSPPSTWSCAARWCPWKW